MPFAENLSGVNMRLEAGAIRELHWHSTPEWAYVLKGTTQVTTINPDGQNYVANVVSFWLDRDCCNTLIDLYRTPVICGTSHLAGHILSKLPTTTLMGLNSFS